MNLAVRWQAIEANGIGLSNRFNVVLARVTSSSLALELITKKIKYGTII